MNGLIAELFKPAKLDSGAVEIKPEAFSLTALVFNCMQDFELLASKKGIELEVKTTFGKSCMQYCFVPTDIAPVQFAFLQSTHRKIETRCRVR